MYGDRLPAAEHRFVVTVDGGGRVYSGRRKTLGEKKN